MTAGEGGLSTTTDCDPGLLGTVTAITAWRWWNRVAENDRRYLGVPVQLSQHIPSRQDQYSQEWRVASDGARPLAYVVGLYGFRQQSVGRPISIYGPASAYWLIGPTAGATNTPVPADLLDGYGEDGRTDFRTSSLAAFGEVDWHISTRLILTGGLRYTHEDEDFYYSTSVYGGRQTNSVALRNADLSLMRPQTYEAHDEDGSPSGRANVADEVAGRVLGYASRARGSKPSGINMSGLPLDNPNRRALATAVVDPERHTAYEVGVRTRLLGGCLILNADAFYTQVRGFRATIVDPSQTVALRGYLSILPEVVVKGCEADATALPLTGLTLRAFIAYADGEYSDYPAGPCPLEAQIAATAACDLTGWRLGSLPRWTATAGLDYAVDIGPGAQLAHVDTASRSGLNGDPSLSRFTHIPGFNLTNANIGYRFADGLEVAVFARNRFDADYIQNVTIQAGDSGLILGTPSDPRVVGATMRFAR